MNATTKRIEEILTSQYSTDNYVELVKEIFTSVRIIAPDRLNEERSNFSYHIAGSAHVGTYNTPDDKLLLIFAVKLQKQSGLGRARSMQRNFAKKLIESGNADAALVAFYVEDDPKWRLSFVRLDYEMKIENGRLKAAENITPAKRYSFLVGKDEPHHTALGHLHGFIVDNNSNPTLDELEEAFSVERVTQEFFDLYCEKYQQLNDWLTSNEDFVEESQRCNFTAEQFAKKLMGQIVFLYFLQKKGWLGVGVWQDMLTEKEYKNVFFTSGAQGRIIKEYLPKLYVQRGDNYVQAPRFRTALESIPDDAEELIANRMPGSKNWGNGDKKFMRTLFDFSQKTGGHFYEKYLEPLFYDTLNKNRGAMGYSPILHCRIPFLSGGLFEPIDGFDWRSTNFDIPDEIFSNKKVENDNQADGILDIFDRYNFTMSEDEPLECEVAIDPEMLGKVFENMLEVKDRKSKGAFYTPREIVHYMCRESLINYLVGQTGISEQAIRDLIIYGDFMKDEDTVKSKRQGQGDMFISEEIFKVNADGSIAINRLEDIDKALMAVRVVDLAVGSGAFPLGLLNEIVHARETLTEYMAVAERAKAVSENQAKFMVRELRSQRTTYDLKRYTIKNSIFAADIEPSAVDIAQLRLWLSLVIDDETNPNAQSVLDGHVNPMPLPNLECNILCGNSLVDEFAGTQLVLQSNLIGTAKEGEYYGWHQQAYEVMLPQLIKAQDELFYCDDTIKKQEIINKINAIRHKILGFQLEEMTPEQREAFYAADKMSSKPFVLWQLEFARVFHEKGGFDIVIGNPPYIGESGHKEIFRQVAATNFGKRFYQGKMDFFYFFFNKGLDVLNEPGELALITTNYYPTATGAKNLRTDLKNRAYIRHLINFDEVRVFESALGQHNMITILTKNRKDEFKCKVKKCEGSYTATSAQMKEILYDEKGCLEIAQDNLYDGAENYIRLTGVTSDEKDSIGSILDKMAAQTGRLSNFADVNQGVVSGCDYVSNRNYSDITDKTVALKDGIFVLDMRNSRDKALYDSLPDDEKKLCRPFFKNSEIQKYHCNLKNTKILIYLSKAMESIDNYPRVKEHLQKFMPVLMRRREAQNGAIKWFQLQWARSEGIFLGEKIVVPYRTKTNAFAYNNVEWFCRSDAYVITPKKAEVDIFCLLGILNSKLNFLWLYYRGKRKGEVLELFQVPLSEIPIPHLKTEDIGKISEYAHTITSLKNADANAKTDELEAQIDAILYQAYQLSDSEIFKVEAFIGEDK